MHVCTCSSPTPNKYLDCNGCAGRIPSHKLPAGSVRPKPIPRDY